MGAKELMVLTGCVATMMAMAAPKAVATAAGFPAWTGIERSNYIHGREITCPSDLRQYAATVVVEYDASKEIDQTFDDVCKLVTLDSAFCLAKMTSWELFRGLERNVRVVIVARNLKGGADALVKDLKARRKDKKNNFRYIAQLLWGTSSVYKDVTFPGAPDSGGKLPFVYVLGQDGTEPIEKISAYSDKDYKGLQKFLKTHVAKLTKDGNVWKPYYGRSDSSKYTEQLEAALQKGKGVESLEASLLKDVRSSAPETAKAAQNLYDALQGTKSDILFVARYSAKPAPHLANVFCKHYAKNWPKSKKDLGDVQSQIASNKSIGPVLGMFEKFFTWLDPDFKCKNDAEAKKIVAEIASMKKTLAPLKESKDGPTQNAACIMDMKFDELVSIIPNKLK